MKQWLRPNVRSLCFHDSCILVQKNIQYDNYYFPGGELEFGESLIDCIKREYIEETFSKVIKADYLFVSENYFNFENIELHSLEHYFLIELDNYAIQSKENGFINDWIAIDTLDKVNILPEMIKNAVFDGSWKVKNHYCNMKSKID